MTRWIGWLVVALVLVAPADARANDDLDRALALYERAEFVRAVAAFDQALASSSLTRAELEAILRGRALAHDAAGDEGTAERDLAAWVSLAPDAQLDDSVRPAMRRLLERVRAETVPLSVEAVALPVSGSGFDVSVRVVGDVAGLVRTIRIVHLEGEDEVATEGARQAIEVEGALRYWVEAVGPGGVVVASAGSRESPRVVDRPGSSELAPPVAAAGGDDSGIWIGVGVGIGVAVVAAVAIVLAVVLGGQSSSETQLGAPMEVP